MALNGMPLLLLIDDEPAQKRLAWRDMLQLRQMLDAH